MKKRYFISIDLNIAGIEAKSEEEACRLANQYIRGGDYSLNVVDSEDIEDISEEFLGAINEGILGEKDE